MSVVGSVPIRVSIPHRQAKNGGVSNERNSIKNTFQFLIGRLKTVQHITTSPGINPFQFLIGRLKTPGHREK